MKKKVKTMNPSRASTETDIKDLPLDILTTEIDTSATTTEWEMVEESCCDQENAGGDRVSCRKMWPCKEAWHPLNTRDA